MSIRTLSDLSRIGKSREVTCPNCKATIKIPYLWDEWVCESCSTHVKETDWNNKSINVIIIKVLEWAGINWMELGYKLGMTKDLPKHIKDQFMLKEGSPFLDMDSTFKWECQHCKECCSKPYLFNDDKTVAVLTEEASLNLFHTKDQKKLEKHSSKDTCAFWDGNCKKHAIRPTFCRVFPLGSIWVKRDGTKIEYLSIVTTKCKGLGMGKEWTVREWLLFSGVLHRFYEV